MAEAQLLDLNKEANCVISHIGCFYFHLSYNTENRIKEKRMVPVFSHLHYVCCEFAELNLGHTEKAKLEIIAFHQVVTTALGNAA